MESKDKPQAFINKDQMQSDLDSKLKEIIKSDAYEVGNPESNEKEKI